MGCTSGPCEPSIRGRRHSILCLYLWKQNCILWGKYIAVLLLPNFQYQCLLQCPKILAIYIAMSQDPCNIYCNVSGSLQYILQLLQYIGNAIYIGIIAIYFATIQIYDLLYVALIIIKVRYKYAILLNINLSGLYSD